jgi:hypothetical protein
MRWSVGGEATSKETVDNGGNTHTVASTWKYE